MSIPTMIEGRTATARWLLAAVLAVAAMLATRPAQAQFLPSGALPLMPQRPASAPTYNSAIPESGAASDAAAAQGYAPGTLGSTLGGNPATGAPFTDDRPPPNAQVPPLLPFGARLFAQVGNFAVLPLSDGQHVIAPGDDVRVMLWGGYSFDAVLKVQKDGTIFLPFAGIVRLAGAREAELPEVLRRKLAGVFTSNVQSSATLASANPVRVTVTGYAGLPGIYEGYPGEGVFAFLKRAGGVDLRQGAFTDVQVIRGGQVAAHIDLYDLLASGREPSLFLQSGDVLHVSLRGPTVTLHGAVNVEAEFELGNGRGTLGDVVALAGLRSSASQVRISRNVRGHTTAVLVALDDAWKQQPLQPGDDVEFLQDERADSIYVQVRGEHDGASQLVLPRGATLGDALRLVKANEFSLPADAYVEREEIRQAQIAYKTVAARQIEQTILGARSQSVEEAQLRKAEADLLLDWVHRLARYDVRGALVSSNLGRDQIYLKNGDVVEIPSRRSPVYVVGSVFAPVASQVAPGADVRHYLKLAGVDPASSDATPLQYIIQHPSGIVVPGATLDTVPGPGDQIFVLPQVDRKRLQGIKDVIQMIYQIAVSAAIAFGR